MLHKLADKLEVEICYDCSCIGLNWNEMDLKKLMKTTWGTDYDLFCDINNSEKEAKFTNLCLNCFRLLELKKLLENV